MAEQTAVVLQQGKKALVAGLSWQPLSQTGYSKKISEIRDLAERIDASKVISLKTTVGDYAGLYYYDEDISDEKRSGKLYSLASAFADKLAGQSAILVLRIDEGARRGDYAVVVIDQGAPSLDIVAGELEAISTVETYQGSVEGNAAYTVYSNANELFSNSKGIDSAYFADALVNINALTALPTDLLKAGGLLVGVVAVVAALFGLSEYLEESARQEQLAQLEAQSKLPQYLQQLEINKRRIGLSSIDVQTLLAKLQAQPVAAKGWTLSKIVCTLQSCTSTWNSMGGYTEELVGFINNQTPVINQQNSKLLSFSFTYNLNPSGVNTVSELPKKPAISNLVFNEKQAWDKSELINTASTKGSIWPNGFDGIPDAQAVHQYPVTIKGSLPMIEDFLNRYPTGLYWNTTTVDLNTNDLSQAVNIELKGAFYAY